MFLKYLPMADRELQEWLLCKQLLCGRKYRDGKGFQRLYGSLYRKNESQDHFDRMLSRLFSDPDVMRYQV